MTRLGRYSDPELVRAIKDLGTPTSQGEVQSLLGLAMVAREYINELSSLLASLQDLIKKGVNVKSSCKDETHGAALRKLKCILTSRPVLLNIHPNKPFRIHVDACRRGRGIGAVLLQQTNDNGGRWQPVAYWSLKLTNTEMKYSATDLECKGLHASKDHAELEEDGHRMLYPGIDTKTIEQIIDDLDIKRNRWGEDEQTIMSQIKLRHKLELLVAMRDDDLDFINDMDPVLDNPEGTMEPLVVRKMRHTDRRLTFGKVSEKTYKDMEVTTQIVRTADRDISYNDQVVWDPFADEQPLVQRKPLRSSDTSWQPDREVDNGVEAETETEAEAKNSVEAEETEAEIKNSVNLSPVEIADKAERVVVNTEYNRHSRELVETVNVCPLGVKDYQKRRRGPRRTASQYRSAAGETIKTVREIDRSELL
jgi:hypothetical protein